MSAVVDVLTGSLLSVSLQVSILVLIIWLISLLIKKATAEFRYLLWCIVLVRLCIPMGINLPFLPSFGNVDLINQQYSTNIAEPFIEQPEIVNNSQNSAYTPSSLKVTTEINNFKSYKIDYRLIAILLWLSGFAYITVITLRRNIILHRKLKKCHFIERNDLTNLLSNLCRQMSIKQNVSLCYMDTSVFSGPVTSGLIKHKIFLPPVIADTWPDEEIEPILLHELSHIKRHDSVINFIQMFVLTIYFFHPLVWLVNSRINTIREEACDDMAIGYLEGETDRYSISILNVIGFMRNEKSYGIAGFGFAEMKNSLGKRLKRILNKDYSIKQRLSLVPIMGLVLIGCVGIAIAGAKSSEKEEIDNNQTQSESHTANSILNENQISDTNSIETNSILLPEESLENTRKKMLESYNSQNYNEAINYGNKIIKSEKTNILKPLGQNYFYREESYYIISLSYNELGNYTTAADHLQKGITEFPESGLYGTMLTELFDLYTVKLLLYWTDYLKRAQKTFNLIVKTNPEIINNEMKVFYTGLDWYLNSNYQNAVNTFNDLIASYPESGYIPTAYYLKAISYSELKDHDKSLDEIDAFIARYPDNINAADALFKKAEILKSHNNIGDNVKIYISLAEKYPDSWHVPYCLLKAAEYYRGLGKNEEAHNILTTPLNNSLRYKYSENLTPYLGGYLAIAKYLIRNGKKEEALDIYKKIMEITKDTDDKIAEYYNNEAKIGLNHMGFKIDYVPRPDPIRIQVLKIDIDKLFPPPKIDISEKSSRILKLDVPNEIVNGSVEVFLNRSELILNKDYLVDYEKKEITLLNEKPFSPKADLKVKYQIK